MSLDRATATELFGRSPVARLASVKPGGGAHIVPVTFALDGAFLFSMVDHKPKTTSSLRRLENIGDNPSVSMLVDHYEEDWSKLWWVRIDGEAAVVESGSNWSMAQRLLMGKYPHYAAEPPIGAAIVVAIEKVKWWEASP